MKLTNSVRRSLSILTAEAVLSSIVSARAQGRGRRGGRGGGLTDRQATAIENLSVQTYGEMRAVTQASEAMARAAFTLPRNDADIRTQGEALAAAQLKWALRQADVLAEIQASESRLPDTSLVQMAQGGGGAAGGGGGRGGGGGGAAGGTRGGGVALALVVPGASAVQQTAITDMEQTLAMTVQLAATARTQLIAASLAEPQNQNEIRDRINALHLVEQNLAVLRADAFAKLQASADKLSPEIVQALVAAQSARGAGARGGAAARGGGGGFGGGN